jgi:hypothetical protein
MCLFLGDRGFPGMPGMCLPVCVFFLNLFRFDDLLFYRIKEEMHHPDNLDQQ